MRKIIEFAVNQLSLSEIVGRYAIENPKSGNVMKKLGFKHEKGISYECNNGTVVRFTQLLYRVEYAPIVKTVNNQVPTRKLCKNLTSLLGGVMIYLSS